MVSSNLNQILQAVQSLNDAERQELRRLLDERSLRASASTKYGQLRQAMKDQGLLEDGPPPARDLVRFEKWQPITIPGKPLSETIIEERR